MRIVLDTNVGVSGLLSPFGAPAQIVRMVATAAVVLCYDARILAEYREVLLRPRFPFSRESVEALIDQITATGIVVAGIPLNRKLPDKDDEPFLEVAVAGKTVLVTGNVKHYPKRMRQGVAVLTPVEFVDRLRQARQVVTRSMGGRLPLHPFGQ